MPTHTITIAHGQGASQVSVQVSKDGEGEDNRSFTVGNGVNQEVVMAIDVSALKMFLFKSDQAVTLRTNANDGTADDSFSVTAGVPVMWWLNGGANPFASNVDVTKLYVQNASGATANIEVRVLQDATP